MVRLHDHTLDTPAVAEAYQAGVRGVLSMGPGCGQRVVRFSGAAANRDGDDSPKRSGGLDLYARQATFSHDRDQEKQLRSPLLMPEGIISPLIHLFAKERKQFSKNGEPSRLFSSLKTFDGIVNG
jgi:hypothetical protein